MKRALLFTAAAVSCVSAARAAPAPSLTLSPGDPRPGDPVLVTVVGASEPPSGSADREPLRFFAVEGGHQALMAVPLRAPPGRVEVRIDVAGSPALHGEVSAREHAYGTQDVVVEEEYVDPPPEAEEQIRADNAAIAEAYAQKDRPPLFRRSFQVPVEAPISASFGVWNRFQDGHESQHQGVDFRAPAGTPVEASNDGEVVLSRDCFMSGKTVVVHHGKKLYTAYLHLSDTSVEPGDEVRRGQVIGHVGATGRTTGPHLHWSVRVGDDYVDPMTFLVLGLRQPLASMFPASRGRAGPVGPP